MPGRDASRHVGAGSGTCKVVPRRSFEFDCCGYVHDASQAFFEIAHQYVVGGSHFTGPSYEPLCTFLRDPELVAAVEELEPNPSYCVASRSLVPRQWKWNAAYRAQGKEDNQSWPVRGPTSFQMKVIRDEHVPRARPMPCEVLREVTESPSDS